MSEHTRTPWGITTLGSIYHPDVRAGLPDGRYVAAVCVPYPCNLPESIRAAWWVLTGRAVAFIYPKPGDLEAIWARTNPTMRNTPRPFSPVGGSPDA